MDTPYLTVDLGKIEQNARAICGLCADHGIRVHGVTKGVCGDPQVARAMLRGGVAAIADSRLINLSRLARAGVSAGLMLLRIPPLSRTRDVVQSSSVSLNSELDVLADLSARALELGSVHDVIIMVDLGDLREGVWPDDLVEFAGRAMLLDGVRVSGLGANLACFAGTPPTVENMNRFVELAEAVESACAITLDYLSAANSSALELIASGQMPRRVNHARIGEAILLGRETIRRRAWPGTRQDAFVLHGEVLEVKRKPSLPSGTRGEDAFGQVPAFENRGERLRALVNLGREDVAVENITPARSGARVIGASSGYLVLDVEDVEPRVTVGDELAFNPGYGALLRAMTSEYVEKRYL